ncbi:hypothetical protein ACFL1A_02090 [Patescibacteria group bacterium]
MTKTTYKFARKINFFKDFRNTHSGNMFYQTANKITAYAVFLCVLIIIWQYQNLPNLVPLWYSRPWGADRLAVAYWIFILPGLSLAIHIVNLFITTYISPTHTVFNKILFISSIFTSSILNFAAVKIIFLVT